MFASAELYFRLMDSEKSSVFENASNRFDPYFGWYPKEHHEKTGIAVDSIQESREYRFTTTEQGFRQWSRSVGGRPRVLIIGDSFTQAERIDDKETYFARLADMIDADFFTFGCSGYGTLQEWMVIDRYFDEIKPDVILMQVCSNDFINSSVKLENASRRHNNGVWRPYPQPDGSVDYDIPRKLKALSWLSLNSRFLFWLVKRIDIARAGFELPDGTFSVTRPITRDEPLWPEFERTEESVRGVLKKLKARTEGRCEVILFNVDQDEPYYDSWKKLSVEQGFTFLGDFEAILAAEEKQAGKPIGRIDDHHWNPYGHERAANYLKDPIAKALGIRP